jgi:hypothetical protein
MTDLKPVWYWWLGGMQILTFTAEQHSSHQVTRHCSMVQASDPRDTNRLAKDVQNCYWPAVSQLTGNIPVQGQQLAATALFKQSTPVHPSAYVCEHGLAALGRSIQQHAFDVRQPLMNHLAAEGQDGKLGNCLANLYEQPARDNVKHPSVRAGLTRWCGVAAATLAACNHR